MLDNMSSMLYNFVKKCPHRGERILKNGMYNDSRESKRSGG
jgi:hypothetical protein